MPYVLVESKRKDQWNSSSETSVLGLNSKIQDDCNYINGINIFFLSVDQKCTLHGLLYTDRLLGFTDGDPYVITFKHSPIGILNALEKMGFTVISTNVRQDLAITHYSWTLYKEIEFD